MSERWPATGAPKARETPAHLRASPSLSLGPGSPQAGPIHSSGDPHGWLLGLSSLDTAISGKMCSLSLWGFSGDVLFHIPATQVPFPEFSGALHTGDCFHEARSTEQVQQGPQRPLFGCARVPTLGNEVPLPGREAEELRLRGSEEVLCLGRSVAGSPWPGPLPLLMEYRTDSRGRKRGAGKGAVRRRWVLPRPKSFLV